MNSYEIIQTNHKPSIFLLQAANPSYYCYFVDPGQVVSENKQGHQGRVGHGNVATVTWYILLFRLYKPQKNENTDLTKQT